MDDSSIAGRLLPFAGIALLVATAAGAFYSGRALVGSGGGRPLTSPHLGQTLAPLSLPIGTGPGSEAGDHIDVAALRGEVVVLDFWASWCQPCRHSIPVLNQLQSSRPEGLTIWGVNVEPRLGGTGLRAAHQSFGARFDTLHDVRGEAQRRFGVTSIPTLVVLGPDGIVRWLETGVPASGPLLSHIDPFLP